jgi:hypothetical protein
MYCQTDSKLGSAFQTCWLKITECNELLLMRKLKCCSHMHCIYLAWKYQHCFNHPSSNFEEGTIDHHMDGQKWKLWHSECKCGFLHVLKNEDKKVDLIWFLLWFWTKWICNFVLLQPIPERLLPCAQFLVIFILTPLNGTCLYEIQHPSSKQLSFSWGTVRMGPAPLQSSCKVASGPVCLSAVTLTPRHLWSLCIQLNSLSCTSCCIGCVL